MKNPPIAIEMLLPPLPKSTAFQETEMTGNVQLWRGFRTQGGKVGGPPKLLLMLLHLGA
jgi:hypothetical protein